MLHKKRQSAIQRPFVKALQTVLRTTPLGKLFFSQIATKKVSACLGEPILPSGSLVAFIQYTMMTCLQGIMAPLFTMHAILLAYELQDWHLQGVKSVLSQAYADATQVTDELVDCILQPGLQVGLPLFCQCVYGLSLMLLHRKVHAINLYLKDFDILYRLHSASCQCVAVGVLLAHHMYRVFFCPTCPSCSFTVLTG